MVNTFVLQHSFDEIIDSYIEQKVGICNHFLNENLTQQLTQNLLSHFQNNEMKKAGIGNQSAFQKDALYRSDSIFWLDKKNNIESEKPFFAIIDAFILYLNETCFTSINEYEFHYTMYEKGDFYKKHFDQFQNNDSRQFSMIIYLNIGWEISDGGELLIYHANNKQFITPQNGKAVFFKSNELAHEVLETQKARMSITGWLKK